MKKQTHRSFSAAASNASAKVKSARGKARNLLNKTKRYIYKEEDLGEGLLYMGMSAATYAALSHTF